MRYLHGLTRKAAHALRIVSIMLSNKNSRPFPLQLPVSSHMYMGLVAIVYLAVRSCYWSIIPIDDGRYYYDILKTYTANPFNLMAGSADHNAQLWMLVAGVPNVFMPDNFVAFNIWLSLLSVGSVIAMHSIIRILTSRFLNEREIALTSLVVAFNPSILCNLMHFSPDMGIYLFMTFTLWALLKEKKNLAIAAGCLLVFSKEQGVAYLALLHLFYAYRAPQWRDKWHLLLRNSASLVYPYALMLIYAWYKTQKLHELYFFSNPHIYTGAQSNSFMMYMLMCFVLNTNWLITTIILICTARMAAVPPQSPVLSQYRASWPAYAGLFLSVLTIVLGVRHFCNDRYMIAFNFVLMLCFIYVLPTIKAKIRQAFLAAMALLMFCQNFRTIDPVSLQIFCSTHLGSHPILYFSSSDCLFHREVHLARRDAYVYNLEYMNLVRIQEEMVRKFGTDKIYLGPPSFNLIPAVHRIDKLPEAFSAFEPPAGFYLLEFAFEKIRLPKQIRTHYVSSGPPQPVFVDGYSLIVQQFIKE